VRKTGEISEKKKVEERKRREAGFGKLVRKKAEKRLAEDTNICQQKKEKCCSSPGKSLS